MRNRISHICLAFAFAAFLALSMTACDSSDRGLHSGFIQGSENVDGYSFALGGSFLMFDSLVPVSLEIVSVDENLDSLMAVKATVYEKGGGFIYVSDSADYESPYLRLTYTCMRRDSSVKMVFTHYVDYREEHAPRLHILGALESERIEHLVQNDGFFLSLAKKKADREIAELLGYEKRLNYPLESDSISNPLEIMLYFYCDIASSDSVFYKNYKKMRSSLGSGMEHKKILPSTHSIDSVFSLYGDYDKGLRLPGSIFMEVMQLWADKYGLPVCDTAAIGDTVLNKNSKSSYGKDLFVCFYGADSIPMWRIVSPLERSVGICTGGVTDTLDHDSIVYRCDPKANAWVRLDTIAAVNYLYGGCKESLLGTLKIYDSTVVHCGNDGRYYRWIVGMPEKKENVYSVADEFVKDKEGACTEEREKERVAVGDAFYRCDSLHWAEIDELTYLRGDCESSRSGEVFHDKKYGTFTCMPWRSGWEESLLPYYHGDKCVKGQNQNEVKFYEDNYFICDNSKWRVLADSEYTTPILEKDFCDSSKLHTFKTFGDELFICEDMKWRKPNSAELLVKEAVARNKFDVHYCDSGMTGTTLFWDSTDGHLYGCGPNNVYREADGTYGWKVVVEIYGSNGGSSLLYSGAGPYLAGGKFTTASTYEKDYKGMHFVFTLRGSYELQDDLADGKLTIDGTPYFWRYFSNRLFVRDTMGHKAVRLDSVAGKSESFDAFYKKWVAHIKDERIGYEDNIASVANFYENAHKTLQAAEAMCPEGFRLPDSTEWRTIVPKVRDMESYIASSHYETKRRYNLFWTSNEKDSETQYCYEYILKQDANVSYYWGFEAGDLIECPKDLYPMVQAICIAEED